VARGPDLGERSDEHARDRRRRVGRFLAEPQLGEAASGVERSRVTVSRREDQCDPLRLQAPGSERQRRSGRISSQWASSTTPSTGSAVALREERWTRHWLEHEVRARGRTPQDRLLAIFDVFDGWFKQPDYEACLFINSLLESHDRTGPIGAAAVGRLENIRILVRGLAEEAGSRDPDALARQIQLVMHGAIVSAMAGDVDAARRARAVILPLLEREELAP
jgi:hypothetical protein